MLFLNSRREERKNTGLRFHFYYWNLVTLGLLKEWYEKQLEYNTTGEI
jgi:hypothetical protein